MCMRTLAPWCTAILCRRWERWSSICLSWIWRPFPRTRSSRLKGSGLLYHRANVELLPLISAGQQEDGLRGGTSNAPTEIVFAKTLRLALEEQAAHIAHVRKINDYARSQLAQIPEIDINSPQEALPFHLNFSCLCIGSEIMLNALDAKGFCVSAQSTCNSKGKAISHVLLAMGKDELHATHCRAPVVFSSDHDGADRCLHSVIKGDYKRLCHKITLFTIIS